MFVCQCELTCCGCVWETKSKVSAWLFCSVPNQAERLKRLLMLFNNTEQLSKLLKMSFRDKRNEKCLLLYSVMLVELN